MTRNTGSCFQYHFLYTHFLLTHSHRRNHRRIGLKNFHMRQSQSILSAGHCNRVQLLMAPFYARWTDLLNLLSKWFPKQWKDVIKFSFNVYKKNLFFLPSDISTSNFNGSSARSTPGVYSFARAELSFLLRISVLQLLKKDIQIWIEDNWIWRGS